MSSLPLLIAQAGDAPFQILLWSAVLIGLLLVAWFVVAFVRSRSGEWSEKSASSPFTLHQLRRLHREGQLTDEEYERARRQVLAMSGVAPAAAEDSESGESSPAREADEDRDGDEGEERPSDEPHGPADRGDQPGDAGEDDIGTDHDGDDFHTRGG